MTERMITVEQALNLIETHVSSLDAVCLGLEKSNGLVLAEDVIAPMDIPAFPQSNMDGYAFAFDKDIDTYEIVGEIAAGNHHSIVLKAGQAVRIFTGAPVPEIADTVLMQEKAMVVNGQLKVLDATLKKGDQLRAAGSEINKGHCAMRSGTRLWPGAIGFLAGIGLDQIKVYPKPRVTIIVTGNELQKPGLPLKYGQVYESNSYTVLTALEQWHIDDVRLMESTDNPELLTHVLGAALEQSDLVLLTGGVSVGEYDFTLKAFEDSGVQPIFHKIKQKPGKPLLFGMKERIPVFGLPGNPASVLTCFYEYVLPAIGKLMCQDFNLKKISAPIAHDLNKAPGLTHFSKAVYDGHKVNVLAGQESYKLSSYATANCLAVIPEASSEVKAGSMISIHLLP